MIHMIKGYSPPPQDAAMDYAGYGRSLGDYSRQRSAPIQALNGFRGFKQLAGVGCCQGPATQAPMGALAAHAAHGYRGGYQGFGDDASPSGPNLFKLGIVGAALLYFLKKR